MSEKKKFDKVLNAGNVLVTAFGAMIGWGWVVSTGEWIQTAGVLGTILAFIIGGVMIYFVGQTYAELTPAMPKCGGEHIYSYKAFGTIGSYICTWALILSYVGVVCFEACSLPTIIQYIFPGFLQGYLYSVAGFDIYASWLAVAIVMSMIITLINIKGVKVAATFQTILTLVIAVVGIVLIAASAINGSILNLGGQVLVGDNPSSSIRNILSVAVMTPFFLFGFDVVPQVAEEINVPLKKIGKLLILSIVLAVMFYALVVLAVGLAMNLEDVSNAMNGSGLVTAEAMAKVFNSELMAKVMIVGGLCGVVTSWNSFMIGGSRALYSMAEAHMIPGIFAKLHAKYKTPINAILLIGVLSVVAPFFGRVMLGWIANAASLACCVAYCIVACSFMIIRKKYPDMERPYKVKHYKLVGFLAIVLSGFLVAMYIIPGTACTLKIQEWVIVLGWTLLGTVFAVVSKVKYKSKFGDVYLN